MSKILLVEDDKSLREIYGVRLLAEGYDIISAGDGEQALAMAIKERPTLIVSDVMMPKISGFDMLDILRSTTETKNIKVIMMTALSSEDQRERGEALGADRYLVKSQVGIEDVVRTVHEVLGDTPGAKVGDGNPFLQQSQSRPPAQAAQTLPPQSPAPAQASPTPPRPAPTESSEPMPTASAQAAQTSNRPEVLSSPSPAPQAAQTLPPQSPAPAQASPTPPRPAPTESSEPMPTASAQAAQTSEHKDSNLPQPTAPFSTNRPAGLGNRIIHPVDQSRPDFNNLMAKELNNDSLGDNQPPASAAPAPQTPNQPASPQSPNPAPLQSPDMRFEETPTPQSRTSGIQPPPPRG